MQTITDLSTFHLEISERKSISTLSGLITRFSRVAKQADWAQRLLKIEKWTNRFCMILVALSVLYFTPVVISILFR